MARRDAGIRAGDTDRAEVVDRLQRHYAAGRLTVEEFEARTQAAYASRTLGDLDALMSDLPPEPDPQASAEPGGRAHHWGGRRRWHRGERGARKEFARYAGVGVMLVGIWALSGRGYFWPAWPLLAFGASIVTRALRPAPR